MSLIQAFATAQYTMMANNAAYSMMSAANSRMGLLNSLGSGNVSFGSLSQLSAMDTNYELQMISDSLQYRMAKAMLENLKKMKKEDKNLDLFA